MKNKTLKTTRKPKTVLGKLKKILGDSVSVEIDRSDEDEIIINLETEYCSEGHIKIASFPGCCGIAVITGLYVEENQREQGLGTLLTQIALHIAATEEKGLVIATDVEEKFSTNIAEALDFVEKHNFVNPLTDNSILVWHTHPKKLANLGFDPD